MAECKWEYQEDEDCWDTECGNKFVLEVGTPIENDFHFCPYCGRDLFDGEIENGHDEAKCGIAEYDGNEHVAEVHRTWG